MDRRDFIKSGLLAAAVGAMSGPKYTAKAACAARRPGILVRCLWRISGEVPTASGYSRSAGEGEGDNGGIILARLSNF